MPGEHDDRVRDRAYHLWRDGGGEHGKEMEHWLQAEREVSGKTLKDVKAASGKTASAKATVTTSKTRSAADNPAAPKAAAKTSAPVATVKKAPKAASVTPDAGKAPAAKSAKPRSAKGPA